MSVTNTLSDLATKQAAGKADPSAGIVDGDDACGVLLFATAKVTIPASGTSPLLNANDTLEIIPAGCLPVGAVVIPQLSSIFLVGDPGTALTLDIGTTTDPDCFSKGMALTVTSVGAGPRSWSNCGTTPLNLTTPLRLTAQMAIIATATTVTSVSETVAVFTVAYRCKG